MKTLKTSLLEGRLNLFYLLVFVPLVLILYSGYLIRVDLWTWIIPFYGFLLLYIKKDKLSVFGKATFVFRIIGLILIITSFFAYYVVVRFFPPAQFYGVANYTIFIIGLFLVFFQIRALREAFSPLFLILGATVIPFIGLRFESSLEPTIPFFVQSIDFVLKLLGIPAKIIASNLFSVTPIHSYPITLSVTPACIGIYSVSTFSILMLVTMMEDPSSSPRTKLYWLIGGTLGNFFVNIFRISLIFVVIYYLGYENWQDIHAVIGYILFFVWTGFFLLAFSKRQAIERGVQTLWQKMR